MTKMPDLTVTWLWTTSTFICEPTLKWQKQTRKTTDYPMVESVTLQLKLISSLT